MTGENNLSDLLDDFSSNNSSFKNFFKQQNITRILLIIGTIFILSSIVMYLVYLYKEKDIRIVEINKSDQNTIKSISIDISGAISSPGLYSLPSNFRINDAIVAAGGFSQKADKDFVSKKINLAQNLRDGQKIYIPFEGEEVIPATTGSISLSNETSKLDLNMATLEQLDSLPGVGPKTAQKILDFKTKNGKFTSVEDLTRIQGLGTSTINKLKDLVTVLEN